MAILSSAPKSNDGTVDTNCLVAASSCDHLYLGRFGDQSWTRHSFGRLGIDSICCRDMLFHEGSLIIRDRIFPITWSSSLTAILTLWLKCIVSLFQSFTRLKNISILARLNGIMLLPWSNGAERYSLCWYSFAHMNGCFTSITCTSSIQGGIWWRWKAWVMEWSSWWNNAGPYACLLETFLHQIWKAIGSITYHADMVPIKSMRLA